MSNEQISLFKASLNKTTTTKTQKNTTQQNKEEKSTSARIFENYSKYTSLLEEAAANDCKDFLKENGSIDMTFGGIGQDDYKMYRDYDDYIDFLNVNFEKYDKNGDGKLTDNEKSSFITAFANKHFDKNGDGKLSKKEKEAKENEINAKFASTNLAQGQIELFDSDKDGKISQEEWLRSELSSAYQLSDYLKKGYSEEKVKKAIENNEDISKYLSDEILDYMADCYDEIDTNKDKNINFDELKEDYLKIDGNDGKQDGIYNLLSFGENSETYKA